MNYALIRVQIKEIYKSKFTTDMNFKQLKANYQKSNIDIYVGGGGVTKTFLAYPNDTTADLKYPFLAG